jgi:hypothetical protein
MHILIDGCYWNTPLPIIAFLPIFLRISIPPDARCRYQPHHIFTLVLPTYNHPGLIYSATCPMLGIRGPMQVYTACHAIYFFKNTKEINQVLIEKFMLETASLLGSII